MFGASSDERRGCAQTQSSGKDGWFVAVDDVSVAPHEVMPGAGLCFDFAGGPLVLHRLRWPPWIQSVRWHAALQ